MIVVCRLALLHFFTSGTLVNVFGFSIYLDALLLDLERLGVGCHWGSRFAGALE